MIDTDFLGYMETIEFEVRIYPVKPYPIFDDGVYETVTFNP